MNTHNRELLLDVLVIPLKEGDGPHHEAQRCLSKEHTRTKDGSN